MSGLDSGLRAAVLDLLTADAGVAAALGAPPRVHDGPPARGVLPYLSAGECAVEPAGGTGATLWLARLTLHLWGRRSERETLAAAVSAVRNALHHQAGALSTALAPGWRCVTAETVYSDVFSAADVRLIHGVVRLRARLHPLH